MVSGCYSSDESCVGDPLFLPFVCRWHGYLGIGIRSVRGWYGEIGEFVAGMAIREWITSAKLAMPFTNVREWPGLLGSVREWRRLMGSAEQFQPLGTIKGN